MDQAKPSFVQSLRTRSLSPQSRGATSKAAAVTKPAWQQYERHVTPDRAAARPAPIRRVFQGIARTASGMHAHQGRAFCRESPEASPSGVDHAPNQAPAVSVKPAKKKSAAANSPQPAQPSAVKPWSPAGKAQTPARAPPECSKPQLQSPAGQTQFPETCSSAASKLEGINISGASPAQLRPIRAGQAAVAALLSKQAAWESTRSTSLPPVLSQITALLCCSSEAILSPPVRTATELAMAANPQLGQQKPQPATAVGCDAEQGQLVPLQNATAVAVLQAEDTHGMADDATQTLEADAEGASLVPAKAVLPALQPSSSSRGFKSELRVSFARQIQTDIKAEGQHAQHGPRQSSEKYFLDEGYFKEAGRVREAGARMTAEEEAEAGAGCEEAEEEVEAVPADSVCGAGEKRRALSA